MLENSIISTNLNKKGELDNNEKKSLHLNFDDAPKEEAVGET